MSDRADKLTRILDIACSVALVCVAFTLCIVLARQYFGPRHDSRQSAAPATIVQVPDLKLTAPRTIILALNTGCHYCKTSVPFYKRLRDMQRQSGNTIGIVALFPNEESEVSDFMSGSKLDIQTHSKASFHKLGITATPTILVADADGRVVSSWVGAIPPEHESQVRDLIFGPKHR